MLYVSLTDCVLIISMRHVSPEYKQELDDLATVLMNLHRYGGELSSQDTIAFEPLDLPETARVYDFPQPPEAA